MDDIFFLKHEELQPVIAGKADYDIQQTIRERRQEYERYKAVDPPQVIIGRFPRLGIGATVSAYALAIGPAAFQLDLNPMMVVFRIVS